jgi:glycine/D-amino acid oxidase-like deaminating enzyme
MDLHNGRPLWAIRNDSQHTPTYLKARGEIRCEVLVVGGGVSGALIGRTLMERGADVVVVDRRTPGFGSTVASTGLLQYEVDTPLEELIDLVGREHAVQAYRRGVKAIDEIEELVDELATEPHMKDRAAFARRKSLYFAGSIWHRRALRREFELRKELGFDVEWLTRAELKERTSISAPAAILSGGDAEIDPFRFTQALLLSAVRGGMRVFGETRIETVDEGTSSGEEITATTDEAVIRAKHIVWATGYEVGESLPKMPGRLRSTYAAASVPRSEFPGWPEGWLLWETARPYFYARRTIDGRIIIGGEDTSFREDHASDSRIERKTAKLRRRFAKLFPEIPFEQACAWGGTFAETKDGLAYIGRVPERANSYAALGYGGNGITFSMIAAKLIADLITGRPNEDAAVFRFER